MLPRSDLFWLLTRSTSFRVAILLLEIRGHEFCLQDRAGVPLLMLEGSSCDRLRLFYIWTLHT